jgi:hypothetical protein
MGRGHQYDLLNLREMLTVCFDPASLDMRYGHNSGRPTTVIPRAAKPSNTKGKQTYVSYIHIVRHAQLLS